MNMEWLKKNWPLVVGAGVLLLGLLLFTRRGQSNVAIPGGSTSGPALDPNQVLQYLTAQQQGASQEAAAQEQAQSQLATSFLSFEASKNQAYYSSIQQYYQNYFQFQQTAALAQSNVQEAQIAANAQVDRAKAQSQASEANGLFGLISSVIPFFCDGPRKYLARIGAWDDLFDASTWETSFEGV